ncbi:succinate dehydrogenase cytochrome b subunit [Dawidia soli]|uniref:Succinate dehydrogenase cytochrome b subunit n=1 Tax=Dawidia soli TaxID=2782352 RepID=A0AAP2DAB7_9BACT|nr:succinate dehydrogenase cytochrome b subunit [Dawidia soli]MBT1687872.1 succinate dehydrogenase cytochrome b subunit [Dawidia soli]
MNWFTKLLTSTLGRKLMMALTGLFLILFLVVHLIGNLQLLKHDGGEAFNVYAKFMTSNPLIKTVSYVNYACILIHIIWALLLTMHNRKARGSEGYAVSKNSSAWTSRNMGILGTFILIFLVIHLQGFWAKMHWGNIPVKVYDGQEVKDLYAVVAFAYSNILWVAIYVFSMLVLAFHLWHGFASTFQTLGLNHLKYNQPIRFVGRAFSIIVPVLFAIIPIVMYLTTPH